ncbi:MAG TPA: hypothetical protein VKU01_17590 [Bryobacteraceae bacterium]|nr:hypothetical protein [Bryobacteraceae bacterium]
MLLLLLLRLVTVSLYDLACRARQHFADGFAGKGMSQIRGDFGQWFQYKAPFDEARMGDLQLRCVDDEIPEEQDVDVDGARSFSNQALSPQVTLNFLRAGQKLQGEKTCFDLDHKIQKPGLLEHIARLSFVQRRRADDAQVRSPEDFERACQVVFAVSDVRPE